MGETVNNINTALDIFNTIDSALPHIIALIQAIKAAPADKPIGEILADVDAQCDKNIADAKAEIERKE